MFQSTLTDSSLDFVNGNLVTFKVLFHDVVINVGQRFDHCIVTLLCFFLEVVWNINSIPVRTQLIFIVNVSDHLNQVNDTGESIFGTDWQLDWQRSNVQTVLDGLNRVVEVRTNLVHLVSKDNPRNVELVSLTPNSFSLRFNPGLGIQNSYGTIKHPERTFNFDSEVHVSWGIDDVDPVVLPNGGRSSGRDSDTTFLFFVHPVHLGSTIVGFTNLVNLTGVVKNPLSSSRLTGIDVGHDTNVTSLSEWVFTFISHFKSVSPSKIWL